MIKQGLEIKQTQKLSPLQIQTIKLIELPIQDLEQRIRTEIEENPVLDDSPDPDKPEDIRTKVMGMFTDPNHLQVSDPGQTEGNPVFMYLDAFCNDEHFAKYLPDYANLDELKAHYQRGGLGDVKVKKFLNNVLQETLEPIRNRREELEKDPGYVMDVLRQGTEAAQAAAANTMAKVKHAMQIDYFA